MYRYTVWIHIASLAITGLVLTIGAARTANKMLSMHDKKFCRSHDVEVRRWYGDAFPLDLAAPSIPYSDDDLRKWYSTVIRLDPNDPCIMTSRHLASAKRASVAYIRRAYMLFSQAMTGYRKPSNTTNDAWRRHPCMCIDDD